jgi:polar amino acid transport system substrate-binding protein
VRHFTPTKNLRNSPIHLANRVLPLLFALIFCHGAKGVSEQGADGNGSPGKGVITVRSDIWFPYSGKPGDEREGFGLEMMRIIFGEAGYEVDYQLVPWKRALEDARTGVIDSVIGATRSEAEGLKIPVESLGKARTFLFTLKNHPWKYKGAQSLEMVRLTGILGYDYGSEVSGYLEKHRFDPERVDLMGGLNAFEKNLWKLERGVVDVIPEDPDVFHSQIQLLGRDPKNFRVAGELQDEFEVFLAFSECAGSGENLVKIWDEGVQRIRENGTLEKILGRYGLSDWKKVGVLAPDHRTPAQANP